MELPLIVSNDLLPDFLRLKTAPNNELREKWNTLISIETEKQKLLTQMRLSLDPVELSLWYQHIYNKSNANLSRFAKRALFLGASGTGKTTLAEGSAHAYATILGKEVYLVELGIVRSKFVGKTSENIHKAFEKVKELAKERIVIFLLDELDSLANQRNFEQMHEDVREAVNTLIKELDKLSTYAVFVIGCSNLEGNIDEAVKRRFSEGLILRFRRPNKYERYAALSKWLEPFGINMRERAIIARRTRNHTHCDINIIISTALRYAYGEGRPLLLEHLLRAIAEVKPTGDYQQ